MRFLSICLRFQPLIHIIVKKIGEWAQKTMKEAAEAAVSGNEGAEAAIKMAKQAATKGQRY